MFVQHKCKRILAAGMTSKTKCGVSFGCRMLHIMATLSVTTAVLCFIVDLRSIAGRHSTTYRLGKVINAQALNESLDAKKRQSPSPVTDIYQQRLALLGEGCKKYKKTQFLGLQNTMVVDDEYHYFFCFIPKVACTSWLITLARASGMPLDTINATISVHTNKLNKYVRPFASFSSNKRSEILRKHFKFMFVRHPFERLISAYFDKIVDKQSSRVPDYFKQIAAKIKRRYRRPPWSGRVTFGEFVRYILDPGALEDKLDRHWRPYYQLCQPCQINYDFIGHYETLQTDAKYVLQRLDISENLSLENPIRRRNSSNYVRPYFSLLANDTVTRLYQQFRIDFDLFGYKWPL